jgi:hypothetical protein
MNVSIKTIRSEYHNRRCIKNILMTIPDAEVLINRIWRTVELHLQYSDGRDPQYDKVFAVELSERQTTTYSQSI